MLRSLTLTAVPRAAASRAKSPKGFCDGSHATATAAPAVRFSLPIVIHTAAC